MTVFDDLHPHSAEPSPVSAASAWLSVPSADQLDESVKATIGPIAEKIGFVPNVACVLGLTPTHFLTWWAYFDELMRGPSGLGKAQREMIAVVISAQIGCLYCTQAHAAALRLRTKDPAFVDYLITDYRLAELETRDRAMLDFAVKLTRAPEAAGEQDIEGLRAVGYDDAEILHIIELAAMFNYTGRMARATGMIPNSEYHTLGRVLDKPA